MKTNFKDLIHLETLLKLQRVLCGKCSEDGDHCPEYISEACFDGRWNCDHCVEMFDGIVDLRQLRDNDLPHKCPCPCTYAPDIALVRLDEVIEELKQLKGDKNV